MLQTETYIKPRTTIRLCSIQFRNVCYRLRLILVLHYTMFRFDVIQYVDRIKLQKEK